MLVLLSTKDSAHPDNPAEQRLINDRHISDIQPIHVPDSFMPVGSIIRMADKRTFRVDQTPRDLLKLFGGKDATT